jgi:hypothetical protein
VPMGERHFRLALKEFVDHYHRERNHQGLENRLIESDRLDRGEARIRRRARLGGLLNCYERLIWPSFTVSMTGTISPSCAESESIKPSGDLTLSWARGERSQHLADAVFCP